MNKQNKVHVLSESLSVSELLCLVSTSLQCAKSGRPHNRNTGSNPRRSAFNCWPPLNEMNQNMKLSHSQHFTMSHRNIPIK